MLRVEVIGDSRVDEDRVLWELAQEVDCMARRTDNLFVYIYRILMLREMEEKMLSLREMEKKMLSLGAGILKMESKMLLLIPEMLKLMLHGLKLVEYQMYLSSVRKLDQGDRL